MRKTSLPRTHTLLAATILALAGAVPALAQEGVDKADSWNVWLQQRLIAVIEGKLPEMEAARLRGDCEQVQRLFEDVDFILRTNRGTIPPALDTKFFSQAFATVRRPCPPHSGPAVESVLDDLEPVVSIGEPPASKAPDSQSAGQLPAKGEPKTEPAENPPAPDRVENLREELEEGLRRQAERRRKALRQQLKPDEQTLLHLHNQARAHVGVPPLEWDSQLAAQAASYGPELARTGRLAHSSRKGRETSRENLLQALPGTPAEKMIAVWTAERQHFVPGIFPDVSRTGNWADVGHYTQMVWPATTRVGCAIHRGGGQFDWLICRYAPPGNQDGKPILSAPPAPPRSS